EEIVNGLLDLVPNREDGTNTLASEPEVPVIEQKIDAVLLRLNRIVDRARTNDCEAGHTHLVSARRARLSRNLAAHGDRRLQRQFFEPFPDFRRKLRLHEHGLHHTGPVANDSERDLARRPHVNDPAANGYRGSDVVLELGNARSRVDHEKKGVNWALAEP